MDEVTKEIQSEVPWRIMFADDIVLVGENSEDEINKKFEYSEVSPRMEGFNNL